MSYHSLLYHIIFRPFNSEPVITPAYERELYAIIYRFTQDQHCVLYRVNGMPDHIHILVSIPPSMKVADYVREVKLLTHKFLKGNPLKFPKFRGWARSYAVLTYSLRDRDMIIHYIKNQKEHHKRVSFQDELRKLLEEEGVEIDERFFLKDE